MIKGYSYQFSFLQRFFKICIINIREGQGSLIGDLEEEEGAQALGPGALRAAVTSTAGEPWESPSLGQEPVKSKLLRLGVLVCSRSSAGHSNTGQG